MRLSTGLFSIFAALSLSLTACGGSGDGGDDTGGDDTQDTPDANTTTDTPDANTQPATKQIGDTCVPDAVTPGGPGDCGAGMACLSLQGGNGAWCSKQCTSGAGDMCNVGYTGPGAASCVFGITFEEGGQPVNMCGIICSTVDPQACPTCDGTCPQSLQCEAGLQDNMMNVVANACI